MAASAETIRVLLVDDHTAFLDMATDLLEEADQRLEFSTATTTQEGLEQLAQHDIDCIVADYAMEERDGIEFLEAVRDQYGELPFIVYTGKGSEEVAARAISMGVTDYIRKETRAEHFTIVANRIVNAVESYRAQQAVETSERELRRIYERITDGFFSVDTDWQYTFANEEGARLVGRSADDLVGQTIWEAFPELVDSPFEDALRRAMETNETTSIEEYYPPLDAWYAVRVYGDEQGISIYFKDVTDRKERGQELRETTRRLTLALEATETGVWEWDIESDEVLWSETLEELLGLEPGTFGGTFEAYEAYVHPEDVARVVDALEEAINEARPFSAEFRMQRADGSIIWVRSRGQYFSDDGPERVVGTTTDITELKEQELALQEQQAEAARLKERLEHALEATDTYVWDWDLDSDEIERSPNPAALFDLDSAALEPTIDDWLEHVHPADRPAVEAAIESGIQSGTGYEFECRLQTGEASYCWVRDRAVVETEDGEAVRAIGTVTDVSEQIERERMLRQLVQDIGDLIDTTSVEETCQKANAIAGDVLEVPLVGIHLISDDGDRLEAVAARDEVRDEFGVPRSYDRGSDSKVDELVWEAFAGGEPMYIQDTRHHDGLVEETPARSGVILPLDGHGVLISTTTEPDAFNETHRAYLELLAQALTAVLGRAEREAQLRHRNQQLEDLHEVGQEIIQAESREEVAERVVAGAQSILNYPISMVRFYDESVGGLVPVAATDEVHEVFDSRTTFKPEGGSLNWSVYESGSPAFFDDITDIDQAVDSESPIRSLMLLPLGEHGTLSVGSTTVERFDESDVSLTQLLATTAELALSNLARQQELISQRDELRRTNERLDEFASVVSHDLRNPLNVAQGRLGFAREECASEHLDQVDQALDRMDTLIDDMLSLASVGEQLRDQERIALADLIESCWANVETASAELVAATEATVQADVPRLRQLLENLIRNAVEHGGEAVTITIGDLPDGFYVEDDGPGIPEAERDDVLEAGYTASDTGTGFGLSIVRDIAEAHDWEIRVTESDAGGARFEFTGVRTS